MLERMPRLRRETGSCRRCGVGAGEWACVCVCVWQGWSPSAQRPGASVRGSRRAWATLVVRAPRASGFGDVCLFGCALWARGAVGVRAHLLPGLWRVAGLAGGVRLYPAAVRVQCPGSAQPAPEHLEEVRSQGPI